MGATTVAKYVVHFFHEVGDPISNLKLQKLLYYAQGIHLARNDAPLFLEDFQAWVHGPVIRAVYGEYRGYRWNPITEEVPESAFDELSQDQMESIKEAIDRFGPLSGWALEMKTHSERPWLETRGDLAPDVSSDRVIPQELIKEFFLEAICG